VGFRGLFGEEPAKQTERSCKAWEFSRSQAQEREAQKDEMQTNPQDGRGSRTVRGVPMFRMSN